MHILVVSDHDQLREELVAEIHARASHATVYAASTIAEARLKVTEVKPPFLLEAIVIDAHTRLEATTPHDDDVVTSADLVAELSQADVWSAVIYRNERLRDSAVEQGRGTNQHLLIREDPSDIIDKLFLDRRFWDLMWIDPDRPHDGF